MNTSTLIPSQNEGLLPVLLGSNNIKQEEPTPYEVVNEPVRKDKRRKHFIEANTEPIDMILSLIHISDPLKTHQPEYHKYTSLYLTPPPL